MADKQSTSAQPELPELTLANVLQDIKSAIHGLVFNPSFNAFVLPALFLLESLALKVIIARIPYTEIDYTAYMEQIAIINSGELDYENIAGGTGPLVYPAGHVSVYKFMNWVTRGVENVSGGQQLFSWIYLLTLALVLVIYSSLSLPPWVAMLLVLSKRLHSIYVLRLFNDCFTTLFVVMMTMSLVYASRLKPSYTTASRVLTNIVAPWLFSVALSIKMNALLYLPGYLLVTYLLNDQLLLSLVTPTAVIFAWQLFIAWNFLSHGSVIRESYLNNAFDFSRKFLYKWSVNWKMIPEDLFNNDQFHKLLLTCHIVLLVLFLFTKWIPSSPVLFIKDALNINKRVDTTLTPEYIVGVLASCNLIGVICARSLHYQFLSWYSWSYPLLLAGSGNTSVLLGVPLWVAHEWCWNVYPSNAVTSVVLLGCNILVLGVYWWNEPKPVANEKQKAE